MTRFWPKGQLIDVTTGANSKLEQENHGLAAGELPSQFRWLLIDHRVEEIVEVWRVDIDWWQTRKWRTYFRLATNTGLLVVIFQDLIEKDWYLQRIYD